MHIAEHQASPVPHEFLGASHILNSLINFLEIDFRNYPKFIERINRLAFYVSDVFIMSTYCLWQRILFNILVTFCRCHRARLRLGADTQYLISALNGAGIKDDSHYTG